MNVGSMLSRHARYRPDRLALVFEDRRLSFAELNARVNRLANALLRSGVRGGDKIASVLPNALELVELYWAAAKIGAAVVPLSPLLQKAALLSLLRGSDSVFVLSAASFAEPLLALRPELPAIVAERSVLIDGEADGFASYARFTRDASEAEPPDAGVGRDHPCHVIFSSGTTGEPKGIVLTHGVRAFSAMAYALMTRMSPDSVTLHAGSLVFNGAILPLMAAMHTGSTFVTLRAPDAAHVVETIAREKATHMLTVPSQLLGVMESPGFPDRLASMQALGTVGAPFLLEQKQRLMAALPGRYFEIWGLTEGVASFLSPEDAPRKTASVGAPMAFTELRIVDERGRDLPAGETGEIVGRSPLLMQGYYRRPDLTAQAIRDGWLFTGDLGFLDRDGYLHLVDRKKDMVISGGVNVYPRDIEEVAAQHPDLSEVAVFGAPDPKWGETPVCAVVARPGAAIDPAAIRDWINARVGAKYQRVAAVVPLAAFPRNVAGKTLKRVLRDDYAAGRLGR
jgi:acyl-CoA synthetase (AMP-forming)/AMP-acid ligase II